MRTAGAADRNLVEKNIWVVWTLRALVNAPFGEILTLIGRDIFMGRTSLSKAFHVIHRFSEDLDITYDIRAIAPDLVAGNDGDDIPPTRIQEHRWSREIRTHLAHWANEQALTAVEAGFGEAGLNAQPRVGGDRLAVSQRFH